MSELQPIEQIWVTVAEGAEKTGFHPDHVRRLARENWRLPEDKRLLRIEKKNSGYFIWLPDLMSYITRNDPFAGQPPEAIWVTTTEASEITAYNHVYLQQIATRLWKHLPEERPIKLRKRSHRYELWLPDLISYLNDNPRRGPRPKK